MSTPIRRTTARLAFSGAVALGSAGLLAGTAFAQYPPKPIDITISTPGATVEIHGSDWGPGTTVTITRKKGARTETTTATVAEDGTFAAPVDVPEDAAGSELQYEISGVDTQGAERTDVQAINVQLTSADMADAVDTDLASPAGSTDDGDGAATAALVAAGVAALAGGATLARRRSLTD